MMFKKLIFVSLISVVCSLNIFADNWSNYGHIENIRLFSNLWHNDNKGGFAFTTSSMPAGIAYFIVKPTDIYLDRLLSSILSAKSMGEKVKVRYDAHSIEGYVLAIYIIEEE